MVGLQKERKGMNRWYWKFLLLLVFSTSEAVVMQKQHQEKQAVGERREKKEADKKKEKDKKVKKKKEITPYEVAQNISAAINWLSDEKNNRVMIDAEPKIIKRRKIAIRMYKAEAFCLITIAESVFPSTREKNISKLLNWPDLHPLLGKDVYGELQKFADINFDYHNDASLKAPQSEIVRDKLQEGIHENIFSMIDLFNKITTALPNQFYYSGHEYEGIAVFDHVLLYELLSKGKKVALSSVDSCFNRWQVALYKNLYYLAKLIAERLLTYNLDSDMRDILKQMAVREPGDDVIALPTCGV